jgi:signal transduction histidine kinase
MKRKLGNYIIAAFIINVFAIMSVGGICILLVNDMVHNISHLEKESEDVSKIDDINKKIHQMVSSIHHAIIYNDKNEFLNAIRIIDDVTHDVTVYKKNEAGLDNDKNKSEVELLEKIQVIFAEIKHILARQYKEFVLKQKADQEDIKKLERLADGVQRLTEVINVVHSEIITGLVQDSYSRMYFILFLYLISAFVGILASCVGYIVLTRHTIMPIKKLASATKKVAVGDFSTRVDTRSETEIGTLYESFNIMTEKLQEIDKKKDEFNRELERKVKERTLQLKKAQADIVRMEKIATLGQIATSVNHEIKTPLNSLYMNLQLLTKQIKQCDASDEQSKDTMYSLISIIDGEITRINGILEEFVKYARFAPPDLKKNDLNKLLGNIAGMISQSAKDSGIDIKLVLSDELVPMMLDEKKMTQALLNLSVNAIHAMPDGGTLTIESSKTKDYVFITVTDTGIGIPEDEIEKIFEPFFTKKEGGLGFGLPIVQRIIEDHKGEISCRSEVGKYTVFEIVLPALFLT